MQANTLEGLIVFLPSLWLFSIYTGGDWIAAALGVIWIVGRVLYTTAGHARGGRREGSMGTSGRIRGFSPTLVLVAGRRRQVVVWALIKSYHPGVEGRSYRGPVRIAGDAPWLSAQGGVL